jgi:flagellar assembly factor FliW
LQIESTRFGSVEVADDAVIHFPDGLVGLPGTHYALIAQSESSPFYWLHSTEHADVALPVTNPWLFFSDYEVKVSDEDTRRLELEGPESAEIFCVVRAAGELADFTVNLVGPVILHAKRRLGRQVINEAGGYLLRQPLFSEVELANVQPASPGVPVAATA